MKSTRALAALALVLCSASCTDSLDAPLAERVSAPVESSTTIGKHLAGYQGWFGCPGDGSDLDSWIHWSPAVGPASTTVMFDAWPEVSGLPDDALCPTDFVLPNGQPAPLFSSYRPSTADRHFQWMADHGLHGVLLQRFSNSLHLWRHRAFKDGVLENVRAAAEAHGRVFAVVYDISGTDPEQWVSRVINDWTRLVDEMGVTESDRYLYQDDLPLVGIWGMGFTDRPGTPAEAHELLDFFKNSPEQRYRATVMGGVPTYWRTLDGDAKTDPAWTSVYARLDLLSPWTVGRYRTPVEADWHRTQLMEPDLSWTNVRGIEYLPVIFPGFSWANLTGDPQTFNLIPRQGGRFYWRQLYNAVDMGASTVMTAMFDEVDEATSIMPVAASAAGVPTTGHFLHHGEDGESLNSDWYLRLAGAASQVVEGTRPNTPQIPIQPTPPDDPAVPETPEEPDDSEEDDDPTVPDDPDDSTEPTDSQEPNEGAALAAYHVSLAYQGILGRAADPSGLASYTARLEDGQSVLWLCQVLHSSGEFLAQRAHLSSAAMARELYVGILGREPDPGGLSATQNAIDDGRLPQRAAAMIESDEAASHFQP